MKTIYIPKRDKDYNLIAGVDVAFAILAPDAEKEKYFLMIAVHGMGELSGGTLDNLKNLVEGFDYNNDGIRDSGFVTADMKKAVDQYGIIIAIPTYEPNSFFDPAKVNFVYDYIKSKYPIYDKMLLTGFSLGGGAVFRYITSTLANANRVAYAIPVAAVTSIVDKTIPGKANLPVHAFSCDQDPRVPATNTKNQIAAINESNPTIKAIYTLFRMSDHAGNIEAWSLVPPRAPGGQGFIDAVENIYQVFTDIVKSGIPRQMKSGAIQPVPIPLPNPTPPPATLTANFNLADNQFITAQTFDIDASASTGVKSGWDAYVWDVKVIEGSAPDSYNVRPKSVYDSDAKNQLINIVDGKYSVTLTVRDTAGNKASKTVTVIAALSGKVITGFDSSTDLITYSDSSTEKGTAVLSAGKWTVKNSSGQIINV